MREKASHIFGGDGWKSRWLAWREACPDKLKACLIKESRHVIGLSPGASSMTFVELEHLRQDWRIVRTAEEKTEAADRASGTELFDLWADAARMGLAREGWEDLPLALCLPETWGYSYLLTLPPGLTAEELSEAAYWELDGKLMEDNASLEEMAWDMAIMPDTENTYLLTAVRKADLDGLKASFEKRGCRLAYLTVPMPPMRSFQVENECVRFGEQCLPLGDGAGGMFSERFCPALYAAAGAVALGGCSWPGRLEGAVERETWNYRGLGLAWLALVACFWLIVIAADLGNLYQARNLQLDTARAVSEMGDLREEMALSEQIRQETGKKEQELTELSKHSFPWYSLLVHFGTLNVEGAWLEEIELRDEHTLCLAGQAVSYEALADLVQVFEKDKDFFQDGPVLDDSNRTAGSGGVSFKMHLKI